MSGWLENLCWGLNAMRARMFRKKLLFSQRMRFDSALRPIMHSWIMSYPDAFYGFSKKDLLLAMKAAKEKPETTKENHNG